jgi:MYXO-CTERM domain-containing protein
MRSSLFAACLVCVLGAMPSTSRAESALSPDAALDAGTWDADLESPDAFAPAPDAASGGIDAGSGTSGGGCSVGSARTGSTWVLAMGVVALLISRRRR